MTLAETAPPITRRRQTSVLPRVPELSQTVSIWTREARIGDDLERRGVHSLQNIDPDHINALTQPRDEFTDIESLATSIASIGPLSEIFVAFFDNPNDCQKYIGDLNKNWKKKHTLEELKPTVLEDGRKGVLIVI